MSASGLGSTGVAPGPGDWLNGPVSSSEPPLSTGERVAARLLPLLPPRLQRIVAAVLGGWRNARERQLLLLSAGLAYHAFLAIFPALIAGVLLYGLFVDPEVIVRQLTRLTDGMPDEAQRLIVSQAEQLVASPEGLGTGLVISLVVALVSASSGISNLITAVNATYGIVQRRPYLRRRLMAFVMVLGAIVFMVTLLALVALLPALFSAFDLGAPRWALEVGRWVVTAVIVAVALIVVYRVFPEETPPSLGLVSLGAVVATLVCLIASAGFSIYVSFSSSIFDTYGAIAGIVVMLVWLWILSLAVLLGAQINVEVAERYPSGLPGYRLLRDSWRERQADGASATD